MKSIIKQIYNFITDRKAVIISLSLVVILTGGLILGLNHCDDVEQKTDKHSSSIQAKTAESVISSNFSSSVKEQSSVITENISSAQTSSYTTSSQPPTTTSSKLQVPTSSNKTSSQKQEENSQITDTTSKTELSFDEERAKTDSLYFQSLPRETRRIIVENARIKYMEINNIDATTIGKTGQFCSWCGKEIWDKQAYCGITKIEDCPVYVTIPGEPIGGFGDDCQYCAGVCGIKLG